VTISLRFSILVITNTVGDKVRAYSIGVLVVIFLDSLVVISNNVKGFLGSGITLLINIVLK